MNIWAVCCYFNYNPSCYRSKNYKVFKENLKNHGIKLLTVEFDLNGVYELKKEDAEILIQLTDGDLMWQKERLINIGIDKLPTDTDIVLVLDTDIVFAHEDIVERIEKAMKQYKVVQCYSNTMQLHPYILNLNSFSNLFKINKDKKYNFYEITDNISLVKKVLHPEQIKTTSTGLAWAYRYETIKQIKMFEGKILGSGDEATSWALLRKFKNNFLLGTGNSWFLYANMIRSYVEVEDINYLEDTVVYSLYHGEKENRRYNDRYNIFNQYDFDSSRDLIIEEGKPFKFKDCVDPSLREHIKQYFVNRKENDPLPF